MANGKATKPRKFTHFIGAPVRALNKARKFYMNSMMDCASRVDAYGGTTGFTVTTTPVSRLPKSFSVNSSVSDDQNLIGRSPSISRSGFNSLDTRDGSPPTASSSGMGMRSYSVGVGIIGRIDEDKPCYFDYRNGQVDFLYTKNSSYAAKGKVVYY